MSDQEAETHQRFSDAEDVSMETQETKKEAKKEVKKETKKAVKKESNKRYITFVGNLPYDVTRQDLETLFKDLEYLSIRLLTDKVTKKPRGIAFVEFADSVNLEKAIELHRSKVKGRKVNIELTAGGGGSKSEVRKERIQAKNKKYQNEKKQF